MNLLKRIYHRLRYIFSVSSEETDFVRYRRAARSYIQLAKQFKATGDENLLIVSLSGMNVVWAQLWSILSIAMRSHGCAIYAVTFREQKLLHKYYRLLGIKCIFYDDWLGYAPLRQVPAAIQNFISKAGSFADFQDFKFEDAPLGQIALSTYSRNVGTGVIDLDRAEVRQYVNDWIIRIWKGMEIAKAIFQKFKIGHLFFTEVFMEEYGAFYYCALSKRLNIMRFAGTVRDNSYIVQHLSKENDRTHHASLSPGTWEKVKTAPFPPEKDAQLVRNFRDRYGDKWFRSRRNQPGTSIMSVKECRDLLGIKPGRKVAVIYSHILYDTLFFFGTDLFENYAQWLVETTRTACENDKIDWLIKVHPSNLWRGELNTLLKGKYEEEKVIFEKIGKLPEHVRIIGADTKINPYSWFEMADFGITVRGTSGLEMAALGKSVITAGTGRYEGNGFTIDPKTRDEYQNILKALPETPQMATDHRLMARKYAHGIFVLKPFEFDFMKVEKGTGVNIVKASDELIYLPKEFSGSVLPGNLDLFSQWATDVTNYDLLTEKRE